MKFKNKKVYVTDFESRTGKNGVYFVGTFLGVDGGATVNCMLNTENNSIAYNDFLKNRSLESLVKADCDFEFIPGQYSRLVCKKIVFSK